MEEAKNHLNFHKDKYNRSIEKLVQDIKNENERLRKEFEEKWNKIDLEMENEKMDIFDRGDDLDSDFINRLHNQCDEKVEEKDRLYINENESLYIFYSDKMCEWMKWLDVCRNYKNCYNYY